MKNEFVMVPRAELVRLQENLDPHRGAVAWGIACDLLARPHQGEPVTLNCWSCKTGFTLKERADCDGCCWKCGVEIDLDSYVEACTKLSETAADQVVKVLAQLRDANDKLAERDALLPTLDQIQRDALYSFYLSICCGDQHSVGKPLIRQLCEFGALESVGFGKHRLTKFGEFLLGRMSAAALSASAEPSAPKDWCSTMERPKSQCGCPDCGSSIVQIGEPSAPVDRDERALIELALSEYGKATGKHVLPGGINENQDGFVHGFLVRAALERKS